MGKSDLERLLARIERYRKRTGVAPTMFGVRAAKTPHLLARLEKGNINLATIQKVVAFLDREEKSGRQGRQGRHEKARRTRRALRLP